MNNAERHDATDHFSSQQKPGHAASDGEPETGGAFTDVAILLSLIGTSIQDAARLAGLEARLVVNSLILMMVLGLALGFVILGIWLSMTFVVVVGLFEYTRLSMTLSIVTASLLNVVLAGVLVLTLKKLAQRLAFPETRLAVRTLLNKASRADQP